MSLTEVQQSAYNDIHSRLDSGFLDPVSHDDVNAVAQRLDGLSAADANAVVAEMRRTGDLGKLAEEGTDGNPFAGGWSPDERKAVFADLAGKLTGDNLAAVSNAFESAESGEGGYNLAKEFGSAVATHASADTKVDFVKALSGETEDGKGLSGVGVGGSWDRKVDGDAAAVGEVLGSLRGAKAEEAFNALSPAQLTAVLKTGIDQNSSYSEYGVNTEFKTDAYSKIMDAAASTSNPDLKARVFDAAGDQLRAIRDTPGNGLGTTTVSRDDALRSVVDGMTRVLDSDVTGITEQLATNSSTMAGSDLSAYAQQMFSTGQEKKLAEQMGKLQFGNNMNEDPLERLGVTRPGDGGTQHVNANTLGYFVGAAHVGARAEAKDIKGEQENVTALLKSLNGVIGAVTGPGGAAIAGAGGEWLGKAVEAAINNPGEAPAQQLAAAALPLRPDPDRPGEFELRIGDPIFSAFEDRNEYVQDNARP